MAIFTRFGNEVKIVGLDNQPFSDEVLVRREDGSEFTTHASELKATNGINEIGDAIQSLMEDADREMVGDDAGFFDGDIGNK